MALPIGITPSLDEHGMEELSKMMDEWGRHKTPIRHIDIDDEVVQRGIRAIEERRKKRLRKSDERDNYE